MSTRANFLHYGPVIVCCCCLIMGINIGLVMSCAGIFYKPVGSALGVSVGDFGLYMTFIYLFSFSMLSVAGKMMDKYSAQWLLTSSSGIVGLLYLGMSQFNAVWQFYTAGALIGVSLASLLYLSYPFAGTNRFWNQRLFAAILYHFHCAGVRWSGHGGWLGLSNRPDPIRIYPHHRHHIIDCLGPDWILCPENEQENSGSLGKAGRKITIGIKSRLNRITQH